MALPMENPLLDEAQNKKIKVEFPEIDEKIHKTFAGFDYEFAEDSALRATLEEKSKLYQKLLSTGGLHFWLGTYRDVLFDKGTNDEAYNFWRQKTLPRIKNPRAAELLAPEIPPHPFGTKRISLEQRYFEIFNQDNIDLISREETAIEEFTPTGIRTQDGNTRDFDVIVFATGFDFITSGITQIDIRGLDQKTSIKTKWEKGTYTYLGMTTSGYPNLFFHLWSQSTHCLCDGPLLRRSAKRLDRGMPAAHAPGRSDDD